MSNLSQHRLCSLAELNSYKESLGESNFEDYKKRVYGMLSKITPKAVFDIKSNLNDKNKPLFIKTACLYMIEKEGDCNIEFMNDYSKIIGIKSFNQDQREQSEYNEKTRARLGIMYQK